MDAVEVVVTPTFDWLAERASACSSRMLIGSPYVNNGIVKLTDMVAKNVPRTLVTRTDLRDFAIGASNLDTLCHLANHGTSIRSLSNFHAKIYVFDDNYALVTSANATYSGMYRNYECGLATLDQRVVKKLARSLLGGLGADRPPRKMGFEELESLHTPLKVIKASLPKTAGTMPIDSPSTGDATFSISDTEMLLKGMRGWLGLTLRGVLAMPERGFQLAELFGECRGAAAKAYPRNQHVEAKLRQQLQRLRDLGLVEFISPGHYRRTMS